MKTREQGQIIIILYGAYLLDSVLDFLKLDMKITLLSKPNLRVEYAGYVTLSQCVGQSVGWAVCQSVQN